jgi:hypothetical protein
MALVPSSACDVSIGTRHAPPGGACQKGVKQTRSEILNDISTDRAPWKA